MVDEQTTQLFKQPNLCDYESEAKKPKLNVALLSAMTSNTMRNTLK